MTGPDSTIDRVG